MRRSIRGFIIPPFSHQLFFFWFFFLHRRRTSLKRKTGTACSLQLPKRLQMHKKFAYCNLSRKLRCYAGISGPEKSRNNTGEKISYLFTCVDKANTICRNFIYKRPARSMYFGLIYDPQAKEKTPLTKYTKNIFVADIGNESRKKLNKIEMYWLLQGRCTLTKSFYFSPNVFLLIFTLYATKFNVCGLKIGCDLASGTRIFFKVLLQLSMVQRFKGHTSQQKDSFMLSSQMDIIISLSLSFQLHVIL